MGGFYHTFSYRFITKQNSFFPFILNVGTIKLGLEVFFLIGTKVDVNKKQYLSLLLLADENEDMIDKYLDCGDLFIFEEDTLIGVTVITNNGEGIFEIKNIAVSLAFQRQGYGRKIIHWILDHYKKLGAKTIIVGTGESPLTLPFYESCGFTSYDRIENFFIHNYPKPIIEGGVVLKDMIMLRKDL